MVTDRYTPSMGPVTEGRALTFVQKHLQRRVRLYDVTTLGRDSQPTSTTPSLRNVRHRSLCSRMTCSLIHQPLLRRLYNTYF